MECSVEVECDTTYGGGLGRAPSHAGTSNQLCLGGCTQGGSSSASSQRTNAQESVIVLDDGRTCSAISGGTQEARKGRGSFVKDAPRAMPGTAWWERKPEGHSCSAVCERRFDGSAWVAGHAG